ncbi:uncharacterized protein LOC121694010 isoform X1 [Alosa sapidissima]|uniref:uncharacterized protein LOC121694010 isoform X1 n=1 Tax=Alosa sapidissima TaxID=34773 RepID=UPI001C09D7F8|nr:uncharacterized protein LOC121694010 isoform X1 [Alosa sapidissima]
MWLRLLMLCFFNEALGHLNASSQAEFNPAVIFSQTTELLEGDILQLKCMVFMTEKPKDALCIYLCKDGVATRIERITRSKSIVFKIPQVAIKDSGNYSCVYSTEKQLVQRVTAVGHNTVFIQVREFGLGNIYRRNAVIFESASVDLICFGVETKTDRSLHVYLCKNGIGVNMDVARSDGIAIFTLGQVRREDSGNYSCVYSIKKHHPGNVTSTNERSVIIQVTEMDVHQWWVNVIRLLCSVGVVIAAMAFLTVHNFYSIKAMFCATNAPATRSKPDDTNSSSKETQQLTQERRESRQLSSTVSPQGEVS